MSMRITMRKACGVGGRRVLRRDRTRAREGERAREIQTGHRGHTRQKITASCQTQDTPDLRLNVEAQTKQCENHRPHSTHQVHGL